MENIIIIGSGPAGLAGAIYSSRSQLNPLVIEGITPGGQLMITSHVENYPGFEEPILGPELMNHFRKHAVKYGTRIEAGNVKSIKKTDEYVEIVTENKTYQSKTVLIATGSQAKWLGIESEARLTGKGVSACATCDGFFFKDKVVAVIGGGDSACEEASYLTRFASKVTIIHRNGELRASKYMQERVKSNPKIDYIFNTQVTEILGTEKVVGLKLSNGSELTLDGVFVAIGHAPATAFLVNSGVLFDEKGYIFTTERVRFEKVDCDKKEFATDFRYMTSIEGIFAAGDCVDHVYKQAGTAVGMGIGAVIEIEKYLAK
ncbi:thioredoxin-disulfide reductase [Candidatus Dojkabacteria bacterium]|nr:thioredoxin-disulfide reductase [Candidatus Dojkabacteria bacterium]